MKVSPPACRCRRPFFEDNAPAAALFWAVTAYNVTDGTMPESNSSCHRRTGSPTSPRGLTGLAKAGFLHARTDRPRPSRRCWSRESSSAMLVKIVEGTGLGWDLRRNGWPLRPDTRRPPALGRRRGERLVRGQRRRVSPEREPSRRGLGLGCAP